MPPSPRPPHSQNLLKLTLPRLYAIIDADVCARENRAPADVARAFLSAGATLIQLRCKSWGSAAFLDLANAIVEDANRAGGMVIVNDRADVAALSQVRGLHVGQDDLTPADARKVIGDEQWLGLSTHTPAQWQSAVTEPVSYIAIGPVFDTGTKATGYAAVGLTTVTRAADAARAAGLPVVAIGGITRDNAASVIDAGAASVAIISDLLHGDPETSCRALLRILE